MVIAIVGILTRMSVSLFARLANSTSVDRDVSVVASYIERARTLSINSVSSVVHGIKFQTNTVTVFKTSTYSVANTESTYAIPSKSKISSINLTGGATSIYFDKLTGVPSATGTITMMLYDNTNPRTITIYGTGVVDIQ